MKKSYLLLTAALLVVASTVSTPLYGQSSVLSKDTDSYHRISVGYNPVSLKYSGLEILTMADFDSEDLSIFNSLFVDKFDGISLSYSYGLNLTKQLPLFLEVGATFMAGFSSGDDMILEWYDYDSYDTYYSTIETKSTLMSLSIPVNLTYKFSFLDKKLAVSPYVGVNFRYLISANTKMKELETNTEIKWNWLDDSMDYYNGDTELFVDESSEEVPAGLYAWKKFHVGLNFGVNINYKALCLGIGYTTDFGKLMDINGISSKMGVTNISLGVTF